jgi:hypothetical protein
VSALVKKIDGIKVDEVTVNKRIVNGYHIWYPKGESPCEASLVGAISSALFRAERRNGYH